MDNRRLILFVIFSFSIMLLWDAWQTKHAPVATAQQETSSVPTDNLQSNDAIKVFDDQFKLENGQRYLIKTDLFEVSVDSHGADIRVLALLKHHADGNSPSPFVLFTDKEPSKLYVVQTGLKGVALPTHHATFTAVQPEFAMSDDQDKLEVKFTAAGTDATVEKTFVFHRGSYAIDVNYSIKNNTTSPLNASVYYQIIHDDQSDQGTKMMPTYTGGAYYNEADKFKKLKFPDMAKSNLSLSSQDGWVGLVQHYFVSAWIPKSGQAQKFYTTKLTEHDFSIGTITKLPMIAAGETVTVPAQLYAGPQTHQDLVATAPGLEYVVDFGVLTIIAKPIMWLLTQIHQLVNNWGLAIILLTVLIKAAFFKLSASGYRNMAQLRELAPRLEALKAKFGDDKQKMQQAMMEMYRTEKINPMGGCLPILIQIPVFISLYWVLLASVESRHAPFFGWIHDLSAPDTLFGVLPGIHMPIGLLPILMGLSMVVQSYLSPAPADPIQAKVMKIMPVLFSVFFFFFPAGLVLYWLVNNILSITQQWYINKTIHAAALVKKGNAKK